MAGKKKRGKGERARPHGKGQAVNGECDRALRQRPPPRKGTQREGSRWLQRGKKDHKCQIGVCRGTTGVWARRGAEEGPQAQDKSWKQHSGERKRRKPDSSSSRTGGRNNSKASTTGNRQQKPKQTRADKSTRARTRWPNWTQPRGSTG